MLSARNLNGEVLAKPVPFQGRCRLALKELFPHIPFGKILIHDAVTEIGGKALVEPEVFPVRRRHQVPEPLMGQLMGQDLTDSFFSGPGGRLRIVEKQVFPECHGAPVFHGPCCEIGNGHKVEFGQRVPDAVILLGKSEGLSAESQAELSLMDHAGSGGGPDEHGTGVFHKLEVAHTEEKKVGGHFGCTLKFEPFAALVKTLFLLDGHVGDGGFVRVDDHFHVKGRFGRRMIHARKGPSGVTLFKLGDGHEALLPFHQETAPVKAGHLVVDLPCVRDGKGDLTLHALRQKKGQHLFLGIKGKGAAQELSSNKHPAAPNSKVQGVQRHLPGRFRSLQVNIHPSFKHELLEVRRQVNLVMVRLDSLHRNLSPSNPPKLIQQC